MFDIISRNVRVPENLLGDLRAQLAAIHVGERSLVELAARWGNAGLFAALDELMAYTERLARNQIAAWPDGTYAFTDYIDDDGLDPDPIPIRASVRVCGDELEVDFEGTSPQVRGAINATGSFARSAVYACVRGLMDSGMPNNSGYFRPITVRVPAGSVINPYPPAAVAARGLTGFRIANALFGALAKVAPDRAALGTRSPAPAGTVIRSRVTRRVSRRTSPTARSLPRQRSRSMAWSWTRYPASQMWA